MFIMWEHSREVVSHLNILLQSMDLDHVQFIKCRCLGVTCTIPWDPFTVLTQSPVTASAASHDWLTFYWLQCEQPWLGM